jgi:hypothetical protein
MANHKLFIPLALMALLLFLLGLGWGMNIILEKSASTLLESTEEISSSVSKKEWNAAITAFQQIEEKWSHTRQYWPLLIHHQEIDRIEECIGKIKSYLDHRDSSNALAEIYVLNSYIQHIPENKRLNLQNIF